MSDVIVRVLSETQARKGNDSDGEMGKGESGNGEEENGEWGLYL